MIMNEPKDIQPVIYTIEMISQRRLEKKQQLRDSKKRIHELTQELFAPQVSQNKMENLMQHVNAGIAAYDGIRTGMLILRRIRAFFPKKKHHKS